MKSRFIRPGMIALALGVVPATYMTVRAPASSIRPAATLTGPRCSVSESSFLVAQSQAELDAIWKKLIANDKLARDFVWLLPPTVDFRSNVVFAWFKGDCVNTRGVEFVESVGAGDMVTIRIDESTFQTSAPPGQIDQGVAASPWVIMALPRTDRTYIVERNAQGIIGAPPAWKEIGRFTTTGPRPGHAAPDR